MTTAFTSQDFEMINDLKEFAKAINFEIREEQDIQDLLKKWVNHRVNLTPRCFDEMFDNYLNTKTN